MLGHFIQGAPSLVSLANQQQMLAPRTIALQPAPVALPPLCCPRQTTITAAHKDHHGLATYNLPHHSAVGAAAVAPWFNAAIRDVVRHLTDSPFLELVRYGPGGPADAQFSAFSVPEAVVLAPELWPSIAETVSSETADVVILVQRVLPVEHPEQAQHAGPDSPRRSSMEVRQHVEEACRRLVATGLGESILQGQVGECCNEDDETTTSATSTTSTNTIRTGILPFASTRKAVKVTALPSPSASSSSAASSAATSGYWGIVVQSRHHTGAEGAYLMKAVRSVPASPQAGGCTCTHFSLTRICQGEHLERQFVESWLA